MFEKYMYSRNIAIALKSSDKATIIELIAESVRSKERSGSTGAFAQGYLEYCYQDGEYYMWETHEQWKANFPWLGQSTIRKYLTEFKDIGLIKTAYLNPDKRIRTLFYTIVWEKYSELHSFKSSISKEHKTSLASATVGCATSEQIRSAISEPVDVLSGGTSSSSYTHTYTHNLNSPSATTAALSSGVIKKYTAIDFSLASRWLDFAKEVMSWKKAPSSWNAENWANDLAKIRRVTDINDEGLIALFEFIKNDDFWMKNAMSPATLLKKGKNDLRKIDNILLKMRPTGDLKQKRFEEGIEDFINEPSPVKPIAPKPEPVEDMSWPDDPVPTPKHTNVTSSFSKGLSSFRKERKDRND